MFPKFPYYITYNIFMLTEVLHYELLHHYGIFLSFSYRIDDPCISRYLWAYNDYLELITIDFYPLNRIFSSCNTETTTGINSKLYDHKKAILYA